MSALSVSPMSEGGWVVKGTLDVEQALQAVVADEDSEDQFIDVDRRYLDPPRPMTMLAALTHEQAWAELAHSIQCAIHDLQLIRSTARPGYYRKVHCLPSSYGAGEGWSWQLMEAKQGPGAFPAVYFAL